MPGDATFIVRRCARAACGDDIIIYDVGNFCSIHTCVVLSEAVCCVEVSTELSHYCQHVVGGWGISTSVQLVSVTQFSIHKCLHVHTLAEAVCCCFPRNAVFTL